MSASTGHADAVEQPHRRAWARGFRAVHGHPRARKWLVRALIAIAGVALLYVIVANVLLRTRLLRHFLNADPMAMKVEYSTASSLWPGHVHATDLSIRGRDSNVEWILHIDDVHFTVSLFDLMRHRFHPTRVRGRGVSFVLRQRIDAKDATPEVLAALPRIDGFAEAPIKDPIPSPPLSDEDYDLWRIHLEDVVADPTREIWIDEGRFVGDARVTGGFLLQPARWVTVGPAAVEIRSGEARTGANAVLEHLTGKIDCTIHPFDVRAVRGAAATRYLDAAVTLDGTMPDLAFLNPWTHGLSARGGGGPVDVDVAAVAGHVTRAAIDVQSEGANVAVAEHAIRGSVHAHLRGGAGEDVLTLEAKGAPLAVQREDAREPLAVARALTVVVKSEGRELEHLFAKPAVAFDLSEAVIPDAGRFDAYLAKEGGFHVRAGHGTLRAHADMDGPSGKADADLTLTGAEVRVKDARVFGDVTVHARSPRASLVTRTIDLSGSAFDVEGVRVASAADGPWSAQAKLPKGHLTLGAGPLFVGSVAAQCQDARPVVKLVADDTALPSWVGDLFREKQIRTSADVRLGKDDIELRNLRLKVEKRFDVAADFSKRGDASRGVLFVTSGPLSLGAERDGDKTRLVTADVAAWFQRAESSFR